MVDIRRITQFYGKWARVYSVVARWTPGIARVRTRAVASLELSRGDTVVEVGCGTGANFGLLRDHVGPEGQVIGIDVTPGMLKFADRRIAREGWDNVSVVQGDARHPPISVADAVLGTFVTGMFPDTASVVSEWCGALCPGGRFSLLDAAILRTSTNAFLRWLFGVFVYLSAPKQSRRETTDLATELAVRVTNAHEAIDRSLIEVTRESLFFGMLHLCTGKQPATTAQSQ